MVLDEVNMAKGSYYQPKKQSDLAVFSKAKELASGIFLITQDAPKKFRFSLVGRMQDISLQLVGHLYRANEIFIDLKIIQDLDRSIAALQRNQPGRNNEAEKHYLENKLLTLKLTKAARYQERITKRFDEQTSAVACLKELDFLLVLAREMQCISSKQHGQVSQYLSETRKLLGGWINSDRKRYGY